MLHHVTSDMDKTLVHGGHAPGDLELISLDKPYLKISSQAISIINKVRETVPFSINTGCSEKKAIARTKSIPHDYLIYEHGGILLAKGPSGNYTRDREWEAHVEGSLGLLKEYESLLHQAGLQTAWEGRQRTYKVFATDPNKISEEEAARIKDVSLEGIALFGNWGKLYATLAIAGKKQAIEHLCRKSGTNLTTVAVLGDDDNDKVLLDSCGYPITYVAQDTKHTTPNPKIVELVRSQENGFVSNETSPHHATIDMLEHAYQLTQN